MNNAHSVFRTYKQSQPECKNCETIFDLFSFSYLWEKDVFVTEYPQTEIMECLTFLKQVLNKCSAFFFSSATFINKYHSCFIFLFITVEFICWFLFSQDILYDIIGNIPMVTFIRLVSLLVQVLSVFLKRNNGRCFFEHIFFFFAQTRREQIQIILRFHKLKESIFTYNPMWVFFRKIVKS